MESTEENTTNVEEQKTAVDLEAVMAKVEQLESSNARLLDESKGWKEKYKGLKENVEKETETKLAQSDQYKELYELEKEKRFDNEQKVRELTTATMQKDLQYKVASLAKDAYDLDDVISNISKTGLLDIDKESGTIKGVEDAYNAVRDKKPYLFSNEKRSGMAGGKPGLMIPKEKTIDEQIEENPNDILANVLKDLI